MVSVTETQAASGTQVRETEQVDVLDREVGAAFIASGFGAFILGLMIVLTEMPSGAGLKSALTWLNGVGPLSGKTGIAVIAFVLSWIGVRYAFKSRAISLKISFIITVVLLVLGLVLSFPPVFEIFAG
jgi:hypothetical protein